MKKIKKILSFISLILVVSIVSVLLMKNNKTELKETLNEKKYGMLSFMLEKSDGSGYEESENIKWPTSEFLYFNNNLSKCDHGSKLKYNEDTKVVNMTTNKTDKCYLYFTYYNLFEYILNDFTKNGDNNLYYHDGNLQGGTGDEEYRYSGTSEEVNNFVCLDGGITTDGKCNNDEDLYRIIGFFKNEEGKYEAKLLKYDYVTTEQIGVSTAFRGIYGGFKIYYKGSQDVEKIHGFDWTDNDNMVNEWADSTLNKENLNTYYIDTYLKEKKKLNVDKLIVVHNWSLNGSNSKMLNPKDMYDSEMNKVDYSPTYPTKTKESKDKIGLMYVSDSGYAVSPNLTSNWSLRAYEYGGVKDSNWIYMGLSEWTISRDSSTTSGAFNLTSTYALDNNPVYDASNAVRPAFYLNTNTKIINGDGSMNNPYRIFV